MNTAARRETGDHPGVVMVFGSNLAGRHGRGAAADARRWHGAVPGVGEGLTGRAYALPTKDAALQSLPLAQVLAAIERFKDVASSRADTTFKVTRVGCGLAGFQDEQIAPAFADAPTNCRLPFVWDRLLGRTRLARVIIAGSRDFRDYALLVSKLDLLLGGLRDGVHVVSGTARGADRMGERYAKAHQWPVHRFPAAWDRHGRPAGMLRNRDMAWAASHLVAFWDGTSPGTRDMIETARDAALAVRVVATS
ncbi:A1S_2505 family phage non-structural protein [Rhodanobacter denitrificans]|uniref:A1S_2505 family phage non-structural protein n=1 Tax=Rhodanobacter denitrificans TaxID=666685 RepID=UPI001F3E5B87|nr:SLOG family protein [Rhodanobacter denitrificans]UJJ60612.1 SLOG family protein [Rhodanobacter denitrificans]